MEAVKTNYKNTADVAIAYWVLGRYNYTNTSAFSKPNLAQATTLAAQEQMKASGGELKQPVTLPKELYVVTFIGFVSKEAKETGKASAATVNMQVKPESLTTKKPLQEQFLALFAKEKMFEGFDTKVV